MSKTLQELDVLFPVKTWRNSFMLLSPAGWTIVIDSSPAFPKKTIRQLQLIQNAAARILTRTRKSQHITPVLRSLCWLPISFRIYFIVLLLVYKSLNGLGPQYIADMLTEYKPNRPLRSLGSSQFRNTMGSLKQGESVFLLCHPQLEPASRRDQICLNRSHI